MSERREAGMPGTGDPSGRGEDGAIDRALDAGGNEAVDERALADYREVLAHLPVDEIPPPPALEARVMSAALGRRPARAISIERAATRRRARPRTVVLGSVVVAAAVIVAVMLVGHSATPSPKGAITEIAQRRSDVDALLRQPGTRTGAFGTSGGRVVLANDGNGDVYDVADRVVVVELESTDGGVTAIGTAHPRAGVIAFVVDHPDRVRAVILRAPDGGDVERAVLGRD